MEFDEVRQGQFTGEMLQPKSAGPGDLSAWSL